MRRALCITVLAVLLLAAAGASARAGTYEVLSCGAAHGINHAWRSSNDDAATLMVGSSCAPLSGGPTDGLFAVDRIPGPPNAPAGRGAGWRLTAPAGTRITGLTAQFYLGQNSAGEWFPFLRAGGQTLETCQPPGGDPECERGVDVYDPLGPMWGYTLNTSLLELGVRCAETMGACGNGASLHHVWAALYYTRVQITDTQAPSVSGLGPRPEPSGYVRGAQTLPVTASDGSGIRETRLEVDGFTLSSRGRACDYTYLPPCANEPGAALELETRGLTDGAHTVSTVAEDAASNVVARSFGVTVDNTAPARPSKLAVRRPKGVSRTSPRVRLRWTNPSGEVAPIVAAHWSICRHKKPNRCKRGRFTSARESTGVLRPALPDGRWDARLWLEDAAGNVNPATAAGPVRVVVKRKNPRIRIRSARRQREHVVVRGTAAVRRGRIRLRVQLRVGDSVRRVSAVTPIRRGRWARTLRLSDRLARASRVEAVVRFDEHGAYASQTRRRVVSD